MNSLSVSLQKSEEDGFYDFEAKVQEVAKAKGCVVVYPKENQLQLDIDSQEAYAYFDRRMADIDKYLNWDYEIEEHFSASGAPNRHITITVHNKTFSEIERIMYQNMLGSDPVREGLNALRVAYGVENPSRLFEVQNSQYDPNRGGG